MSRRIEACMRSRFGRQCSARPVNAQQYHEKTSRPEWLGVSNHAVRGTTFLELRYLALQLQKDKDLVGIIHTGLHDEHIRAVLSNGGQRPFPRAITRQISPGNSLRRRHNIAAIYRFRASSPTSNYASFSSRRDTCHEKGQPPLCSSAGNPLRRVAEQTPRHTFLS